jgi:hypothetical protein
MKILLSVSSLLFVFVLTACEYNDIGEMNGPVCGVQDPIHDLAWLKDKITSFEAQQTNNPDIGNLYSYFYISQATMNGETVFVLDNCCPFCNTRLVAFNCAGDEVEVRSRESFQVAKIIWKPQGFQCSI